MNLRFSAPTDRIVAAQTSCGAVTVTEESSGSPSPDPSPDPSPGDGGDILPDDPVVLGGAGLLVALVVALLVI